MDHGNDSMLDAFLFETDDLLERLDGILISCEKNKNLDTDSVNEIFRIMHTIKGSSAMMRLDSITEVAYLIEWTMCLLLQRNKVVFSIMI